jgi:hypothetical protein
MDTTEIPRDDGNSGWKLAPLRCRPSRTAAKLPRERLHPFFVLIHLGVPCDRKEAGLVFPSIEEFA